MYSILSEISKDISDKELIHVNQSIKFSDIYIKKAIDYMWLKYPEKISFNQLQNTSVLKKAIFQNYLKKLQKHHPSLFY